MKQRDLLFNILVAVAFAILMAMHYRF